MRREDGEMDKSLLRRIPKVDELLAPVRALCPNASSAAVPVSSVICSIFRCGTVKSVRIPAISSWQSTLFPG